MSILLAISLLLSAIVGVSIVSYIIDCLDAWRAKKRRWSDLEHTLLGMSIKLVK